MENKEIFKERINAVINDLNEAGYDEFFIYAANKDESFSTTKLSSENLDDMVKTAVTKFLLMTYEMGINNGMDKNDLLHDLFSFTKMLYRSTDSLIINSLVKDKHATIDDLTSIISLNCMEK